MEAGGGLHPAEDLPVPADKPEAEEDVTGGDKRYWN